MRSVLKYASNCGAASDEECGLRSQRVPGTKKPTTLVWSVFGVKEVLGVFSLHRLGLCPSTALLQRTSHPNSHYPNPHYDQDLDSLGFAQNYPKLLLQ